MGITGLISFCEKATTETTLTRLPANSTAAVDSYCLLHRGSYGCADKLVKGIKTDAHIDYAMKYVKMLLAARIKPIMVFDGRSLPAKAETEKSRRQGRDAAKEKAKEFLRAGKTDEARKEFTKAVDITHEHAIQLMTECRKIGVDCITAMYEADSQLAYLNKIGLADYVISEDSDLILFGCKKILFKLQLDYRCTLFEAEKLHLTLDIKPEKFTLETFRRICILSGCDYLKNLPGIGLKKAAKFFLMTEETDMRKALPKIPQYLNMRKLEITEDYIESFLKADATFQFMYVFDPKQRKMVRLNDLDAEDPRKEDCSNAGELLDPNTAHQLALGNLNPKSLRIMTDFNPDSLEKPSTLWGKRREQQKTMTSFFSKSPRKQQQLAEVQNIMEQENDFMAEVEMDDLVTSYASTTNQMKFKRKISEIENKPVMKSPTKNPFVKRQTPSQASKPPTTTSLLKVVSKFMKSDDGKKVVSRFFAAKEQVAAAAAKITVTEEELINYRKITGSSSENEKNVPAPPPNSYESTNTSETDKTEEILENSNDSDDIIKVEYSFDEGNVDSLDADKDSQDVIDLEQYSFKKKVHKQTFINDIEPKKVLPVKKPVSSSSLGPKPKVAVSKNKSDSSSTQSKLSKFGFQVKSFKT